MAVITATRRYTFQAVHALHVGVHREHLHGHSYGLEVSYRGAGQSEIDAAVESLILRELHGRELGGELDPATGEVIVEWIHQRLGSSPVGPKIVAVALQETRKNRFVSARSEAAFV